MNVDKITAALFLNDRVLDSDVGIVLGVTAWQRASARAVELYRSGRVRQLAFTGGPNSVLGESEAGLMADFAIDAGVPRPAVLVEPRARNTAENFAFSRALVEANGKKLDSIMLVAIGYHLRRALIAAREHLPETIEIGWVTYPSLKYSAQNWHQSEAGRRDVASELDKIQTYYGLSLDDLVNHQP